MPDIFANDDDGFGNFLNGFQHGFVEPGKSNILSFTQAAKMAPSVAEPFAGLNFDNE